MSLRCPYCTAEVDLAANECGHCGSALEKPLAQGDLLDGRFELRRVLGFGALGTTYLARDRVTRTELLVKILSPQLVPTLDDCEQLGTQLEMFEGRVIAGSAMHIEVGLADLLLFVTYPIVDGVSLREVLDARSNASSPVTHEESLRLLLGIIAAVSALHSATPHGALRPENIMITRKGVILTNGAIVGAVNPEYFQPRMRGYAQAVPYIAPEVLAGKKVTATADLFAIGAIAAELLSGTPSAHGLENVDISPPILQGIRQLLERDRTKRPGGQALILNELCKVCGLDRRPPDAPLAVPDVPSVVEESDDSTTVSVAPSKPLEMTPAHGRAYVPSVSSGISGPVGASRSSGPSPSASQISSTPPPATPSSPQAITQPSLPTARVPVGRPAAPSPAEHSPTVVKSTLPSTTIPRSGIPGGTQVPVANGIPGAPSAPMVPARPSMPSMGAPMSKPASPPSAMASPAPTAPAPAPVSSASARGSVPPPAAQTRSSFPPRAGSSQNYPTLSKLPPQGGLPGVHRTAPIATTPSGGMSRPMPSSMPKVPEASAPRVGSPSMPKSPPTPAPRVPNLAGLDLGGKGPSTKPPVGSPSVRPLDPKPARVSRDPEPVRGGFSDIDTGEIELLDD